ncbi:G/T mismatch-specific thymine DNA glycosylase-like [Scleropages formosus]|uniref:G/T mismatch-specific thymine DNA glycosylase n=1 Tax=Scleropages formosus TaxID=113540 RepID=A0A8C9V884_SCLFO|nr:G/T mismatch-specific thymine DNA glycosylase-like [Scleropages formosus]
MEENQFASLRKAADCPPRWFPSIQHMQALQAHYQQMASIAPIVSGPMEQRMAGEQPAHQEPRVQEDVAAPAPAKAPAKGKRGRPANKEPKSEGEPEPKVKAGPKPKAAPKAKTEPKGKPGPKPKKAKEDASSGKQEKIDEAFKKVKRKVDRFNGMTEAEVMTKTLPDILTYNLDFVIIGINPGLMAAYIGRWFPGPGNHFWKCLFMSGISEVQLNHMDDQMLPEKYGIGFTNMVQRATPGSKDLTSKELREGGKILVEKLKKYKPLIAVFNGKCIYEMFCREIFGSKPKNLEFGLQPLKAPDTETLLYLMPSSSARCAQFPRAQDKVHYYIKLKELRDQIKGVVRSQDIEEVRYTFDLGMAKEEAKKMAIKEEQYDPGYEAAYGGAYGEPGPDPEQSNGHCSFASAAGSDISSKDAGTATTVGQVLDGQWMMQSFADQIPDIGGNSNSGCGGT